MASNQYYGAWGAGGTFSPRVRPMLYVSTAITMAIVVTVFAEPSLGVPNAWVLVPAGFICLGMFTWRVKSATPGLLRLVFVFLAMHAVIGYLIAPTSLPWMLSGTLDQRAFSLSFVVVASGLMAAVYAYQLSTPGKGWLPKVDAEKLVKLAKWMTVAALGALFYLYNKNQLLPWQVNLLSMNVLRYSVSGMDEWFINRCTEVLMVTVPLLFMFGPISRCFAAMGGLGLALTFVRAPILDVILVVALANVIRTGKLGKLLVILCLAVGAYAASQLFYFGVLQGLTPESTYHALASALPEVRDLAWILWLNGHELHWGTTLVPSVLPVPSVMAPWIQQHSLRGLTTRMIGYDWDEMGGLRLTLAGEGYLNFGMVGALTLAGIWGWGMRKIGGVVEAASRSGAAVDAYFAALLVSWMAFWIYLGGSQASGIIRSSVVLVAVMFRMCRNTGRCDA